MKKQIIALTVCLSLTAASAFAACPTCQKEVIKQAPQDCPKTNKATDKALTKEQQKKFFEEKMTKRRDALYCKLGLTPEQKVKAEELDAKNKAEAVVLIDKVKQERAKLEDLKAKKACPVLICKQKQQLKSAKHALRKHFKASQKSFDSILTKEQLVKLQTIRAEKKAEFKKHCKCKGKCHCHKHPHMFEEPPMEK